MFLQYANCSKIVNSDYVQFIAKGYENISTKYTIDFHMKDKFEISWLFRIESDRDKVFNEIMEKLNG